VASCSVHRQAKSADLLLALFAFLTRQLKPEPTPPTFGGDDPKSFLPRGIVSDVLRVTTGQVRYPVANFVLMESDDRLFQWSAF
jgi:hypothetical protein